MPIDMQTQVSFWLSIIAFSFSLITLGIRLKGHFYEYIAPYNQALFSEFTKVSFKDFFDNGALFDYENIRLIKVGYWASTVINTPNNFRGITRWKYASLRRASMALIKSNGGSDLNFHVALWLHMEDGDAAEKWVQEHLTNRVQVLHFLRCFRDFEMSARNWREYHYNYK